MMHVIYISNEPQSLGDGATKADVDRYATNLAAHLATKFPGRFFDVLKVGGTPTTPCPTDDAINEYVNDLHAGSGWTALLRADEAGR